MSTQPQKIDEVLEKFAIATHEATPGSDENPNFTKAKAALSAMLTTVLDAGYIKMNDLGADAYEAQERVISAQRQALRDLGFDMSERRG